MDANLGLRFQSEKPWVCFMTLLYTIQYLYVNFKDLDHVRIGKYGGFSGNH